MSTKPTRSETHAEPAAVYVPVSDLLPWVKNPRKNDKAVDGVVRSIEAFGFGAPLLARRENGEIIAGHTRLKAALKLGMETVPVRYMDLEEAHAHALAVADNKLGEAAKWDDAVLAVELAEIQARGIQVEVTGFADHELRKLRESLQSESETDDGSAAVDAEPDRLQKVWGTAIGQTWAIPSVSVDGGVHLLRCGSSTDGLDVAALSLAAGRRADAMWTDPPYGVAYVPARSPPGRRTDARQIENDALDPTTLQAFLEECFKLAPLVDGAPWYICHPAGPISLPFMLAVNAAGWLFRQGLVWVKDTMVLGRSDYHYRHETVMFGYTPASKGRRGRGGVGWFGGNAETSVFEVDRPKVNELHPTMKPTDLVVRMLENSCPKGGTVYEPFCGSGTTVLAAERCGRLTMAMELSPKYVAVALERMAGIGCRGQLLQA